MAMENSPFLVDFIPLKHYLQEIFPASPPGATERFIEIEPLGEGIDGFVWRDVDKEVEPDSDAF